MTMTDPVRHRRCLTIKPVFGRKRATKGKAAKNNSCLSYKQGASACGHDP